MKIFSGKEMRRSIFNRYSVKQHMSIANYLISYTKYMRYLDLSAKNAIHLPVF